MANPRKSTVALQPNSDLPPPPQPLSSPSSSSAATLSSIVFFFKRPSVLPLLLSLFVLLTWLFLQLEHPTSAGLRSSFPLGLSYGSQSSTRTLHVLDSEANVVRFDAAEFPSKIARDWRGWLMDPVKAAREAGLLGRALKCASVHVGQIRPGGIRGNHRHNMCNETFILWGAETKFRLENPKMKDKGYAEVTFGSDEVVLAVSPQGTAHAIINIDSSRATFFLGCQDNIIKNSSGTDYNVWKDL